MNIYEDKFDCNQVLLNMSQFAKGEADPVLSGRIEGHISFCERCAEEYGKALEKEIALSEIAVPSPPGIDFIQEKLIKENGIFGFLYDMGKKWKEKQTEKLEEELKVFINAFNDLAKNFSPPPQMLVVTTLGGEEEGETEVEVLDHLYKPSGEKIKLNINEKPHISPLGKLRASFSSEDKNMIGRIISLTLQISEEQNLTFTKTFTEERDNIVAFFSEGDFEIPCTIPDDKVKIFIWPEGAK